MKNIISRMAEEQNTTPEHLLKSLLDDARWKTEAVALMIGTSSGNFRHLMAKYGFDRLDRYGFDYEGEHGSMTYHCKRFGLKNEKVRSFRSRNGISAQQALDLYRSGGHGGNGWLSREMRKTGKTPKECIEALIVAANGKYSVMEEISGLTRQALYGMVNRYKVKKADPRAVEYEGITDTARGHARRLGLNPINIEDWRQRNKATVAEALNHFRSERFGRREWKEYPLQKVGYEVAA